MADSSNHGKEPPPPKESSSDKQSSSNNDISPPPPAPMAPPHMMYYPPGPGYPGHGPPPPYHPYPPPPQGYAPYPNEYPHGYNNYPPGYYGVPSQNYNGGKGFIRGFIMCSCILFTAFFVSTLIIALTLHPRLPAYNITSLSVTNFNTTPVLTGEWNISVLVKNPNGRLRSYFSEFRLDVVHGNDAIALTFVPDFELEKNEEKQLGMRASSSNNGVSFQNSDLDKINKERVTGSMTFGVRIYSMTSYKSDSFSTRSALTLGVCEGIKVVFQNNTGTGTLDNGGNPVYCQVYV